MTLAQKYLELKRPNQYPDDELSELVTWSYNFVRARLRAPRPNNVKSAEQTAERYVFETNPVHVVTDLIESKSINRATIFEVVKLPHINFWVEYPISFEGGTKGHIGYMVGQVPRGKTALEGYMTVMVVVLDVEGRTHAVPFACIALPEFPVPTKGGFRPFYYATRAGEALTKDDVDACEQFVQELVDCLFLITVPRVVEYRDAAFGPRKEKVQRATGKPLVEFKRVHITIGAPDVRSKAGTDYSRSLEKEAAEGGRRYHRVGPFFRTYRKRQKDGPKVVMLDTFWRGNPELGIIIKEKHYDGPKLPGPGETKTE
jgi:hypothetical protein